MWTEAPAEGLIFEEKVKICLTKLHIKISVRNSHNAAHWFFCARSCKVLFF